ncbi:MAG: pyridoxamine 5'-phosphate oxidase family protein [Desulfuromonadales bacterium]|uniref:pyridoxamine 5'-phosphate oxidase family protein n=1 Tax=Desulfuromonas sp. KJ2020 TaxID=2919173 RepID=UPI0020A6E9B2|nr:pyridoxamine 5'-phosphate oxidase family protein [Desulfuromonas sp. KJ2020]MCP3177233.1 pyridoxamine 5'-phosphate oxidase family protein [Desulfuromonas sp. KJ2020]
MNLHDYFENTQGTGILSTADGQGRVDCAIYARPHVMDDGNLAMIMLDRLSHHNLQSNPHAAYMFIEEGPGYRGKRLFLTKVREETDSPLIETLSRRYPGKRDDLPKTRYLVIFRIDKELPLIGSGQSA